MQLISVNVGQTREVPYQGRLVRTAILKQPVAGRVWLSRLLVEGDDQANRRFHGGADQAAYAYDVGHYRFWQQQTGRNDFEWGQFGENLTVEGMPDDRVCIGDVYRVGEALVQVSHPRVPCFKLGWRMNDPQFVASFFHACRIGFYLRVMEEGHIGAGDSIQLERQDEPSMTVSDVYRLMHLDKDNVDGAAQAALLPGLSLDWREKFLNRRER